jgi:Protein of unknown function (DUF1573).
MANGWVIIFVFIGFALSFSSCKKTNPQRAEAEKIVAEWMGKTIVFPNDILRMYLIKDSIDDNFISDKPFKVLLYTDSVGCTSCKLRLFDWKRIMQEVDSAFAGKVDFLFYFQPKDQKELNFLFRRDRFEYPVFVDMENQINKLNGFPANDSFQCFLLDSENKVISIGNPSLNPTVWNLYKQLIGGKTQTEKESIKTTVQVEETEIKLENLSLGKATKAQFTLTNTGNNPLIIHDIKSACGCTVPTWERRPIEPNKNTKITVEITPEEANYFDKAIKAYCNTDDSPIQLRISGRVKE